MHAVTALAAVIFQCQQLDKSVEFYRALGVDVRETKHGGTVHFSCSLGGVHFALYPGDGTARGPQSGCQLGLMITNLDGSLAAATALGASVLAPPVQKPWGMTAMLEDPDGRKIELVNTKGEATGPMPF
jgi:predicted enzyme related to lactoylglutathione lyase